MPLFIFKLLIILSLSVHGLNMSHAIAQGGDRATPDGMAEQLRMFQSKMNRLLQDIELLTTQPGWPEMMEIINLTFSAPEADGHAETVGPSEIELDGWRRKWRADGRALYTWYLTLAERSRDLEAERLAMLDEWRRLRQELMRLVVWLMVQGEDKIEASIAVLKLLGDLERERQEILGRYTLDALELCYQR